MFTTNTILNSKNLSNSIIEKKENNLQTNYSTQSLKITTLNKSESNMTADNNEQNTLTGSHDAIASNGYQASHYRKLSAEIDLSLYNIDTAAFAKEIVAAAASTSSHASNKNLINNNKNNNNINNNVSFITPNHNKIIEKKNNLINKNKVLSPPTCLLPELANDTMNYIPKLSGISSPSSIPPSTLNNLNNNNNNIEKSHSISYSLLSQTNIKHTPSTKERSNQMMYQNTDMDGGMNGQNVKNGHSSYRIGEIYECVLTRKNGGLGLTLACVDDHVQITGLAPDSPASESGISVGDVLVAVGGLPVQGLSFNNIIYKLKSTPRTAVLKLRRQNCLYRSKFLRGDIPNNLRNRIITKVNTNNANLCSSIKENNYVKQSNRCFPSLEDNNKMINNTINNNFNSIDKSIIKAIDNTKTTVGTNGDKNLSNHVNSLSDPSTIPETNPKYGDYLLNLKIIQNDRDYYKNKFEKLKEILLQQVEYSNSLEEKLNKYTNDSAINQLNPALIKKNYLSDLGIHLDQDKNNNLKRKRTNEEDKNIKTNDTKIDNNKIQVNDSNMDIFPTKRLKSDDIIKKEPDPESDQKNS